MAFCSAWWRATSTVLAGVALLLLLGSNPQASNAATLPANFQESTVFSGLSTPTVVRFASDGRVFVAEKGGVIKVFDNLADTTPTVFADLNVSVDNFWDRGLLGMALDPNFPTRPYVYVLYTYDKDPASSVFPRWGTAGVYSDPCPNPPGATVDGCVVSGRLTRLTASGNVSTGGEDVLITDWCQQYPSHSIGSLQFGADGMLYVSGGDGASFNFVDYGQDGSPVNPCGDPPAGSGGTETPPTAEGGALRSQDLRTTGDPAGLNGAILRIDPNTGAAPPDNPNSLSPDPNARRIIAYGTRNPFRFTIRPGTNEVWIGDVGWNDWEEINRIQNPTAGVINFGWPCYEGVGRQPGYDGANLNVCEQLYSQSGAVTPPYYTYNHANKVANEACPVGGSSISGLAFYNGGNYPAAYTNALFFADYSRNCIWAMQKDANGLPNPATIVAFDDGAGGPVDLEIGPNGDLFYCDFNSGTVQRIRYVGANQQANAVATATPLRGVAPLNVSFDGSGSGDPEGGPLTYAWDLDGDGAFDDSTAVKPTYTYTQVGNYTARLQVTDNAGNTSVSLPLTISATNVPPTATIASPASTLKWRVGDTIDFSGSATDAQGGTIPPSGLSWRLNLQHCSPIDPTSCHTHQIQTFDGVASGSFSAPDHEYPSYLQLTLTATDSQGLSDSRTVRLDPETVNLTFQSNPSGLQLAVGSTAQTTPFTRAVIIGSTNSLIATTPQSLGGQAYQFTSWSDGGAQTHTVVAGPTAATYTATFTATTASSLVAAYSFDEGSGTSTTDASGNGHVGTIANATWASAGKFGKALSFNGTSARVNVTNSSLLQLSSAMTLEAWVNPAVVPNDWADVIYKGDDNYYLEASSWGTGRLPAGGGIIGGASTHAFGSAVLAVNTWTHLAVTYDGSALRLYVNGTQVASTAKTGALLSSTSQLQIGGDNIYGQYFQGLIDEVRVFNVARTQAQVQSDMNTPIGGLPGDTTPPSAPGGLAATPSVGRASLSWIASSDNVGVDHYNVHRSTTSGFTPTAANRIAQPTTNSYVDTGLAAGTYYYVVVAVDAAGNVSGPSNEASAVVPPDQSPSVSITAPAGGATVSGTINVTASASDDVSVAGVQFQLDGAALGAEDTAAPYSVPWLTTAASNGSHRLTAVARDGAGHQTTSVPVDVTVNNPPAPSGLVAAYSFNEGSGTTVADASGNGNGGTVANTTWTTSGKFGKALSFNGTSARVNVPNAATLQLSSGMTLEAWVNPTTVSNAWRDVVYKGDDNYYLEATSQGGTRPVGGGIIGGTTTEARAGTALTANTWAHLAVTYDGAAVRLYVNGVQAASTARTGAIRTSTNPLQIGSDSIYGQYFRGTIDEVRVYNVARTQAQIQSDMNTALTP